ncbi:KRAB-A domain-containing 2-like [Brachionus plicatilis]|uniref:KRAB-A domain-containing 2-like n=1 Tax=Brachionus plicatilis TaxID=10195 RepID=A0A3M7T2D0_BRAPC|nr:KRAB-A domain-containing 2-like [Brachionus plicatilis]
MDSISESIRVHKNSFYAEIDKVLENSRKARLQAKSNPNTKNQSDYYLLKKYQLFEISGVTRLISKVKDDKKILIVVPYEETFDEIHTVHLSIGHGGVNKMMVFCLTIRPKISFSIEAKLSIDDSKLCFDFERCFLI